jgi:hypothetical protein
MSFLALTNPPLDNLAYFAHNTATMTQDYAKTFEELNQHSFSFKIRLFEISSIAMIALTLLAATLINSSLGVVFAVVSLISLMGLTSQMKKEKSLLSNLEKKRQDIDRIVQNIIFYLQKVQIHKVETLINVFNDPSQLDFYDQVDEKQTKNQLEEYAIQYDSEMLSMSDSEDIAKCREYIKITSLARSILEQNNPTTLSPKKWSELQEACFIFLNGEGSIFSSVSGECWSEQVPYVKLEMESPNKRWIAKKY